MELFPDIAKQEHTVSAPQKIKELYFSLYSLLLNNHQGKNFHWSFKKIREMAMTR